LSAIALVLLSWYRPSEEIVLCPFRLLTGMLCPLCGITRGVSDVLHGDWLAAIRHHVLSPLAAVVMACVLILSLLGRSLPNRVWVYLGAAILVFGFGRLGLQASFR